MGRGEPRWALGVCLVVRRSVAGLRATWGSLHDLNVIIYAGGTQEKITAFHSLARKGLFLSPSTGSHWGENGIMVQGGVDLVVRVKCVCWVRGGGSEDSCQSGYYSLCAAPLMPVIAELNLITALHDGHRRRGPKEVLAEVLEATGK